MATNSSNYDAGIAAYERGHYEVALYDFEQRAMRGDGDRVAEFYLGYMYKHGKGVAKDLEKAVEWYRKAAERGYVPAVNDYAVATLEQSARFEEEFARIRKSFVGGHEDVLRLENEAEVLRKNVRERAVRFLQSLAEYGNPTTQFNLGIMCIYDYDGLPEDLKKPEEWFQKAANQGHVPAQYYLARTYEEGLGGVTPDLEKALEWYTKAAKRDEPEGPKARSLREAFMRAKAATPGYAPAQSRLAEMYREGKGVDQNLPKAFGLHHQAAAQGYAESQFALGVMYAYGEVGNPDSQEAFQWYQKAAKQGYAPAQNNLALMYLYGEGVSKNSEITWRLTFEAAQQGYAIAQSNLGKAFASGLDEIPRDDSEAYYWYSLAVRGEAQVAEADRENATAELYTERENVGNRLTEVQKNEIQQQVADWQPKVLVSSGTGFYITKTHILTNEHVVRSYDEVRIPYQRVTVSAVDTEVDFALLVDSVQNTDPARFRSSSVELGEEIAVFGYPLSRVLSYEGNGTLGTVSGLASAMDDSLPYNRFQHTAHIQGGNSGGPVLDAAGNVVGVVVSALAPFLVVGEQGIEIADRQNVNFAIKFNVIEDFLKENQVTDYEDPIPVPGRAIDWGEVFKKAQMFTLPVLCFVDKGKDPLPLEEIGVDGLKR